MVDFENYEEEEDIPEEEKKPVKEVKMPVKKEPVKPKKESSTTTQKGIQSFFRKK